MIRRNECSVCRVSCMECVSLVSWTHHTHTHSLSLQTKKCVPLSLALIRFQRQPVNRPKPNPHISGSTLSLWAMAQAPPLNLLTIATTPTHSLALTTGPLLSTPHPPVLLKTISQVILSIQRSKHILRITPGLPCHRLLLKHMLTPKVQAS